MLAGGRIHAGGPNQPRTFYLSDCLLDDYKRQGNEEKKEEDKDEKKKGKDNKDGKDDKKGKDGKDGKDGKKDSDKK